MVNAGTGFAMSSEPNAQPGGRIYGRKRPEPPALLSQKGWPNALPIARSPRHPSGSLRHSIEMPTEVMVGANA
jgi:hypothetical protein